jgi:hypothetical protein
MRRAGEGIGLVQLVACFPFGEFRGSIKELMRRNGGDEFVKSAFKLADVWHIAPSGLLQEERFTILFKQVIRSIVQPCGIGILDVRERRFRNWKGLGGTC